MKKLKERLSFMALNRAVFLMSFTFFSVSMTQNKKDLSYEEFIEKVRETKGMVIDARTPSEYESGHLANSVLIDFRAPDFVEKIGYLDRKGHYFLYCRTGKRTAQALETMQAMGFKNIFHLKGGVAGIEDPGILVKE